MQQAPHPCSQTCAPRKHWCYWDLLLLHLLLKRPSATAAVLCWHTVMSHMIVDYLSITAAWPIGHVQTPRC